MIFRFSRNMEAENLTRARKTGIMTLYPMKGVERMKRLICALLCMAVLLTGICFAAAEEPDDEDIEFSSEEEDEIRSLDEVDEKLRERGLKPLIKDL